MLSAGAVVALALTHAASARRRSRDLALLKTLGFVRRQVVAVVIWQALAPVAIGTVIGVPLGIATGRFPWTRFASELYVVPQPAISMVTVAVVAIFALALAILTAIVPGWGQPGRPLPPCSGRSEGERPRCCAVWAVRRPPRAYRAWSSGGGGGI
jgi:putative ABC transport system permease protein